MSEKLKRCEIEISKLVHPDYNPRIIDDAAMKGLKSSIEQFGLVQEIVVNKSNNHIIGGNQRVTALREMGVENAPIVYVDIPELEEKALNIALNSQHISGQFTPAVMDLIKEIEIDIPEIVIDLRLDLLTMDEPGPEEPPPAEDPKIKPPLECPECGHIFYNDN